LSSSPLLNNSEYLTKAISNIAAKTDLIVKSSSGNQKSHGNKGGQKKGNDDGISGEKIEQLEKETCKCALEMNHGLMVEALKNFMFTAPPKAILA
jgi:hypothetical protein